MGGIGGWKGKRALVTGASSGMGVEWARQLAAAGVDLVLTARRGDLLEALAAELRMRRGVDVRVLVRDLAEPDAAAGLFAELDASGLPVDILINNAGFGTHGFFLDAPAGTERAMLQVNVVALVELTRLAAARMKERGWGRILQVASLGAYQPTPNYASYAAAKAFVLNYGLAVRTELRGSGVGVTVLSPGITRTGFFDAAGYDPSGAYPFAMMSAEKAVAVGLRALAAGRSSVAPGFLNKALAFLTRLVPRSFASSLARSLSD